MSESIKNPSLAPAQSSASASNSTSNSSQILASIKNVSKHYGKLAALNKLNFSVQRAEIVALLGPNGAGKTTTVSLLLNLIEADSGEVSLFGQSPQALSARQRLGVMLQSAALPETLRVAELIALTQSYYPHPRPLKDLAELAGITDILQRPYGKLSGGQQRRVQFAMAICAKVELLFLDEPTVGLDIDAREIMWRSLRMLVAEGCSIVLTTHYLEEAEVLADRVVVIAQGAVIAEGSVEEIRARVSGVVLRKLRCVTQIDIASIRLWPHVNSVVQDGQAICIETLEAEAIARRLLNEDASLQQLEIKRAGLAEAFIELTKENMQ